MTACPLEDCAPSLMFSIYLRFENYSGPAHTARTAHTVRVADLFFSPMHSAAFDLSSLLS